MTDDQLYLFACLRTQKITDPTENDLTGHVDLCGFSYLEIWKKMINRRLFDGLVCDVLDRLSSMRSRRTRIRCAKIKTKK